MKIILLNPPLAAARRDEHLSPPLGLGYLAAVLKRAGHEVSILDMALGERRRISRDYYFIGKSWDEAGFTLAREKPDMVGVSCPFSSRLPFALRAVNLVRECLPQATVVMGGLHPSISPQAVLEGTGVDFVVIGEGENVLLNLVQGLESGEDVSNLKGLAGSVQGEGFFNEELDLPRELDAIPHPARELINMEAYLGQKLALWSRRRGRQTPVITSRGCPQKCTFCSVHKQSGRKWRGRSPENVLEELELLKREYRIDSIAFFDDNFAFNRKRIQAICRGILEKGLNINWIAPNGITVKTLDKATLTLMKESGCSMLNLAVESGDEYILNSVIRKNQSLEQMREAAENCRELNIAINGYFVIGMPGETENTIIRSLEFAKRLPLRDVGVFIATPFPGTELYQECLQEGYIEKDICDTMFSGSPDNAIFHRALIETPVMSRDRIEWWEKEFHREFWRNRFRKNPLLRWRLLAGRMLRAFSR